MGTRVCATEIQWAEAGVLVNTIQSKDRPTRKHGPAPSVSGTEAKKPGGFPKETLAGLRSPMVISDKADTGTRGWVREIAQCLRDPQKSGVTRI